LLLPASAPLLSSLIPSSTLTLLSPHPPQLLSYLSKAYLTPIEASPKFWQILETAQSRHLIDDLSLKGEAGLEVGQVGNMVIQTLVRKAAGGSKGISRSLEAFSLGAVKRVSDIMEIIPMNAPTPGSGSGSTGQPPKTHADLDLPFNLNLTDSQKAARMGVPLPYAHEGEGAAVDLEIDEDEDLGSGEAGNRASLELDSGRSRISYDATELVMMFRWHR
jgi:elongator complex protein 5